ncbi:MAG: hypothetical protein JNM10_09955 [Planctomycetia bacterium]|nr:hypothetical protein [Planctomycetia bacterium]
MPGLFNRLRIAFIEDEEAAAALENAEQSARGIPPDAVCCTMHEPGGKRVVLRWGDIKPRALARRERARKDLARARLAIYEVAGDDLDPTLLDSVGERVHDELEAWHVAGDMEDYAEENDGGVSNESYARAQENLDRAIRAREAAQTDILVQAEARSRAAPPPPAPTVRPARARTPRRAVRSRASAGPGTTSATADGDPPAAGDPPPPGLPPAAHLAALRAADPETLAAIRDALGGVPYPRFVPSESQRALWAYLLASPVARSLDLLALDLRRAKRTVLRDFRVLETRGIVRRVEGGGLLVAPLDGNQRGTRGELTGAPSSGSVVSR